MPVIVGDAWRLSRGGRCSGSFVLVLGKSIHDTSRMIAVFGPRHISTTRNGELQLLDLRQLEAQLLVVRDSPQKAPAFGRTNERMTEKVDFTRFFVGSAW